MILTKEMQHLFNAEDDVKLEDIISQASVKLCEIPLSENYSFLEYQSYLIGYLMASGYKIRKNETLY